MASRKGENYILLLVAISNFDEMKQYLTLNKVYISYVHKQEFQFLRAACHLMVLYICVHLMKISLCKHFVFFYGNNCIQNFRKYMYIQQYTSPNEKFEYGYPHSNALLQFRPKLEHWKPHKAAPYPTICDKINDVKLFPMLSNQTSRYKIKCIRRLYDPLASFILCTYICKQ